MLVKLNVLAQNVKDPSSMLIPQRQQPGCHSNLVVVMQEQRARRSLKLIKLVGENYLKVTFESLIEAKYHKKLYVSILLTRRI